MRSAVLTSEILERKGARALKPLKPQQVSKCSLEAERLGRREQQPWRQSSTWEGDASKRRHFHFQYWNPELVCGLPWFGCLSWAKAAEFRSPCASQEAWGDGCSLWALLMLEAGQPARSVLCTCSYHELHSLAHSCSSEDNCRSYCSRSYEFMLTWEH